MGIVGVILAGGLSSRMKLDKSELLWEEKTLLEHTRSLLEQAGCQNIIISDNKQQGNIADRFINSGPLAGIEACLHHLLNQDDISDKHMILMPVDMPLMTVNLLNDLMLEAKDDSAVYYSLGRFPLILPIKQDLLDWLTLSLEKNKNAKASSIKQMLSQLPCRTISIDNDQETAFNNCNTPEQWQTLQNNLNQ